MVLIRFTNAIFCSCAVFILLQGCSSNPVNIAPMPPSNYKTLGHAMGDACGSLGLASPGYYFIPMMLNSRVDRAYKRALDSVPGATALINTELKEDWYWWFIGTARCTTVSGDAIREIAQ